MKLCLSEHLYIHSVDLSLFKDLDVTEHDVVSIGTVFTAVSGERTASIFSAQAVHEDLKMF